MLPPANKLLALLGVYILSNPPCFSAYASPILLLYVVDVILLKNPILLSLKSGKKPPRYKCVSLPKGIPLV